MDKRLPKLDIDIIGGIQLTPQDKQLISAYIREQKAKLKKGSKHDKNADIVQKETISD